MKTVSKFLVVAAALVLLAGCNKNSGVSMEVQDADASIEAAMLRSAPTSKDVVGVPVKLETTVTRKFVGEEGGPINATFTVVSVDGKELPVGLRIVEAWVAGPTTLWETDVIAIPAVEGVSDKISAAATGGPKWEVGTNVHGVVRLKDADGNAYLLRQEGLTVSQVE